MSDDLDVKRDASAKRCRCDRCKEWLKLRAALREKDAEIARLKAKVEHLGAVVKSMGRDYAALQSTTRGDPRHD